MREMQSILFFPMYTLFSERLSSNDDRRASVGLSPITERLEQTRLCHPEIERAGLTTAKGNGHLLGAGEKGLEAVARITD